MDTVNSVLSNSSIQNLLTLRYDFEQKSSLTELNWNDFIPRQPISEKIILSLLEKSINKLRSRNFFASVVPNVTTGSTSQFKVLNIEVYGNAVLIAETTELASIESINIISNIFLGRLSSRNVSNLLFILPVYLVNSVFPLPLLLRMSLSIFQNLLRNSNFPSVNF